MNSSKRSMRSDEILRKEYVCSKEGTASIGEISERKRRRGMTQEGCNAKLISFKSKSGGAITHQRHVELIADYVDINEKPMLKLPHEMENQMSEIYTRKMFYEFQDEFWESFFYNVELSNESGGSVYKVFRRNKSGCRAREIVYEKELDYAICNCKKFKSDRIACRHIFGLLC
ncbi:hypothetical protein EZV62_019070 [Acer yangbiense]|uniref:Protein FAR1-RELATED SEQUENCE n=1 Tax=Acer yangbiense TaxID=1000413 RepID=A0A5C7HA51_9ROSI|nr:hypothetical protein EZV62_019070 [Acer yangbiense]